MPGLLVKASDDLDSWADDSFGSTKRGQTEG